MALPSYTTYEARTSADRTEVGDSIVPVEIDFFNGSRLKEVPVDINMKGVL